MVDPSGKDRLKRAFLVIVMVLLNREVFAVPFVFGDLPGSWGSLLFFRVIDLVFERILGLAPVALPDGYRIVLTLPVSLWAPRSNLGGQSLSGELSSGILTKGPLLLSSMIGVKI